ELFYPFTLTFAVHLALFEVGKLEPPLSQRSTTLLGALYGAKSWLMLFVPFMLIEGLRLATLPSAPFVLIDGVNADAGLRALIALPLVVVATIGFLAPQPRLEALPTDTARWVRQAAWSSAGSVVGLVPLFLLTRST